MRVVLPVPEFTKTWPQRITDALNLAFLNVVSNREAVPHLFMSSPDGTVYKVTVDNAGVLAAAVHNTTERY